MTYKRKEVIGGQTLYLGDCMEVMAGLGKVDAVVTDPPFSERTHKGHDAGARSASVLVSARKAWIYCAIWGKMQRDRGKFCKNLHWLDRMDD